MFEKQEKKNDSNISNGKSTIKYVVCCIILLCGLIIVGYVLYLTVNKNSSVNHSFIGTGTKEDPYQIASTKELLTFAAAVNTGNTFEGQYIILESDLDMREQTQWSPIGTEDPEIHFSGHFDGNSKKITNLNMETDGCAGLFVNLDGIVSNLTMENCVLKGSTSGGIAATTTEHGSIINCCINVNATGDVAGGVAGNCKGSIINCTNFNTEEEDGVDNIVGTPEDCIVENCYTNKGGSFEIKNNTSTEADIKNRKNAMKNLNEMLGELSVKYQQPQLYLWELSEDNQPILSPKKTNVMVGATLEASLGKEITAEYVEAEHAWCFLLADRIQEDQWKIQIQFQEGNRETIQCDSSYGVIQYTYGGIAYQLECLSETLNNTENDTDIKGGAATEQHLLNLSETDSADENVKKYHIAYINEKGELQDTGERVVITQPGTYDIQGSMNGQLVVDMGSNAIENGNAQAALQLNNVNISNKYGPGITIKNVLETGDYEQPGIKIELIDGTSNTITASNSMNIYSDGNKSEGAISTAVTAGFYGNDGILQITGDLEGIESDNRLSINGGTYYIKSNDDGINTSKDMIINSGYLVIDAGDDVLDSNENITLANATVIGYTPTEHVLNGDKISVDSGMLVGSSSYENNCSDDSRQGMVELKTDDIFPEGMYVVMTNEQERPILGMQLQKDAKSITISMPELIGNTYHFYTCSKIQGTWKDGVCRVTDYTDAIPLVQDGKIDFTVKDRYSSFQIEK